jgi:hypothetical protein
MAKKIYNKNAREAHLMAEAYQRVLNEGQMHTFGNVQFEPLGKDANNAEAFRVYKDGNYVLYATMFGPRQTVTFYTDPKDQAGPDTPLAEFNLQQVPGGIEQAAAAIGAAEDAEGDWAENTPAGREDGNEPDNRNKGDTPWYDVKDAEDAEDTFKVGDWVYDSDGSHASIVSIDGDEVALYDGKEGWTTHISEIKPEEYDEGLYPKSLGSGGSITSSQKFL